MKNDPSYLEYSVVLALVAAVVVAYFAVFGFVVKELYNYAVVSELSLADTKMSLPVGIAIVFLCSILFKSSSSSSSKK